MSDAIAPAEITDPTLSATLLRLRVRQPFLAALALFARYEITRSVPTAATDGLTVFVNPDFWSPLTPAEQDGLLLHEVLHAALGHCTRRGVREPQLWNIAADIVINSMILAQPGGALPAGGMRDDRLAQFSSEEVYELLQRDMAKLPPLTMADLLDGPPDSPDNGQTSLEEVRRVQLEGHWRSAMQRAQTIAATLGGSAPAGLARELGALAPGRLDWRAWLWRFLVQTPTDYSGFDRRFIGRGIYLEALQGESVRVHVCVDTSGSIGSGQLASFLGEIRAILSAYPHIVCDLFFADAALHGPQRLHGDSPLPAPVGGGGTSFVPFFDWLTANADAGENALAVYLTDGHGTFPAAPAAMPVLWVVTPGGLDLARFPFGEAIRMVG
jgi:predicted metal-dependent peptidase